jgi:hypothetical protein
MKNKKDYLISKKNSATSSSRKNNKNRAYYKKKHLFHSHLRRLDRCTCVSSASYPPKYKQKKTFNSFIYPSNLYFSNLLLSVIDHVECLHLGTFGIELVCPIAFEVDGIHQYKAKFNIHNFYILLI